MPKPRFEHWTTEARRNTKEVVLEVIDLHELNMNPAIRRCSLLGRRKCSILFKSIIARGKSSYFEKQQCDNNRKRHIYDIFKRETELIGFEINKPLLITNYLWNTTLCRNNIS